MSLGRKTKLITLASALACVAYAPASFANTNFGDIFYGKTSHVSNFPGRHIVGITNGQFPMANRTLSNGSSTATKYYKFGVSRFEKGNLESAEKAFKAVLRANGLDKQAYYYLAKIKEKQGNQALAIEYAQAFYALDKR